MRIVPLNDNSRGLDAGLIPICLFNQLDVELPPLGPAHIHAQKHSCPVTAFGAACARVHFEICVIRVRLAGEQRFELAPFTLRLQTP
jgi:hypothetical protein